MCGTTAVGGASSMLAAVQQANSTKATAPATPVQGGGGSDAISSALAQLVAAVQALGALIGGVAGGGAKAGVQQLAAAAVPHGEHDHGPSAPATASVNQYGLGADTSNEAGSKTNVSNSKGDWKRVYARPAEDRAKGAASLKTMMDSTAKYADTTAAAAAGYDFSRSIVEGTLVHVPNPTFAKQYGGADLNHPSMLLYRKTDAGLQLIGNVMTASKQAPDLGMGSWHTHQKAGTTGGNTDLMMHVWFLPNNLDAAFSEAQPKA